jgi:Leucine-rich repeat (LRR) protein
MKSFALFILMFFFLFSSESKGQYVAIPDSNFKAYLELVYPACMSGGMLDTTCTEVLSTNGMNISSRNIVDLTGIQYFDNITELYCRFNQITSLPKIPTSLKILYCGDNQLTVLPDLPSTLESLYCENNLLTSLPSLPTSLTILNCMGNKLTSLPTLPSSLQMLFCGDNELSDLPALPASLTNFGCYSNHLTSLPVLPPSLVALDCSHNQIGYIPALPATLNTLALTNNGLIYLPPLPAALEYLSCGSNNLTSLPTLPPSLVSISCRWNQLYTLPELPHSLKELNCELNQLTYIPELPASLKTFRCYYNFNLNCLPYLPDSLAILDAEFTKVTCLPNLPANPLFNSNIGYNVCDPLNNINGCLYPFIAGTVFVDLNQNGIKDSNEKGYMGAKVEIQPGNYIVTTDTNGYYSLRPGDGKYSISVYASDYPHFTSLPSIHSTGYFSVENQEDLNKDFALQANAEVNNLEVSFTVAGRIRTSGTTAGYVTYKNTGTTILSGSVHLEYDPSFYFAVAYPAQESSHDNLITWNFTDLYPGEERRIQVLLDLLTNNGPGTILNFTASIDPVSGDADPTDNEDHVELSVVDSYNANFKEVTPALDIPLEAIIDQNEMTYTIHFQNTGNDKALTVIISDTISDKFEIMEIENISSSHFYTFKMHGRTAVWTFPNILLPDQMSNESSSHGFIKYKIVPSNKLNVDDELKNTASIYFDYNTPVFTNTTVNKVVDITGIRNDMDSDFIEIFPNPSNGLIEIKGSFKGVVSLEIISTDGKVVYQTEQANHSDNFKIDLSDKLKGFYFVKICTNEKVISKKLILD